MSSQQLTPKVAFEVLERAIKVAQSKGAFTLEDVEVVIIALKYMTQLIKTLPDESQRPS